jgi:predicted peptidase
MNLRLLLPALLLAGCSQLAPTKGPRVIPPLSEGERAGFRRQAAQIEAAVPVDAFEAREFRAKDGSIVRYRLLRPADGAGRRVPLLVIFHGSGAIGADNRGQLETVPKGWAVPSMRSDYPALVVVPQFASRAASYAGNGATLESRATPALEAALELIDELRRDPSVDPARTFAIGFSMGGSAVWNAILLRPGMFRAAVAISGIPNRAALAALGTTRLLVIHGDAEDAKSFGAAWAVYQEAPEKMEFWRLQHATHEYPPQLIGSRELAAWLWR